LNSILVTGATGFVGQRLVKAMSGEIRVISRMQHPCYKTVICDLQHDSIPDDALYGVDTVFHLAGIAHDLRNADTFKDSYQKINVDATIRLAKLAIKFGVKKFIFVSSVKAGGSPLSGQCDNEEAQKKVIGVYGQTKRDAELRLLELSRSSNMDVSIIRPSLVYGPGVKGNLQLMLSGIRQGWFPPLPNVNNKRSMIHVDDLVYAILFIAKDSRANGEVFIATDGTPYSSREIYNAMCSTLGKPIPGWSVPKILFNLVGLLSAGIRDKINKLLGDECYTSAKLEALGFEAKKTIKQMHETDF